MQKIFALVLLALAGCGKTSTPALPPTAGDFVKNDNGIATAQAFGIDFSVRANSGGASTNDAIEANFVEPQQSRATKRFTLGDDIAIQLDSVNESEVRFMFNDQDFGILKVGNKVVIDDERNVEVNGKPHPPMSAE